MGAVLVLCENRVRYCILFTKEPSLYDIYDELHIHIYSPRVLLMRQVHLQYMITRKILIPISGMRLIRCPDLLTQEMQVWVQERHLRMSQRHLCMPQRNLMYRVRMQGLYLFTFIRC